MSREAFLIQTKPATQDGPRINMIIRPAPGGPSPTTSASTTSTQPSTSTPSTSTSTQMQSNGAGTPRSQIRLVPYTTAGDRTAQTIPRQTYRIKGGDKLPQRLMKLYDGPASCSGDVIKAGNLILKPTPSSGHLRVVAAASAHPTTTQAPSQIMQPRAEGSPLSPLGFLAKNTATYTQNLQIRPRPMQWNGQPMQGGSDSSTTPDSGIQSVPGTPNAEVLSPPNVDLQESLSSTEDPYDEADFADMPKLLPADQEPEVPPSTSLEEPPLAEPGPSRVVVEESVDSSAHGSECEQPPVPSINISPGMDPNTIAEILASNMDADQIKRITDLMRLKAKEGVTKERLRSESRGSSVNDDGNQRKQRPESSASEELKRSEEEGRQKAEEEPERSNTKVAIQNGKHPKGKNKRLPPARPQRGRRKVEETPEEAHDPLQQPSTSKTPDDASPAESSNSGAHDEEPEPEPVEVPPCVFAYREAARRQLRQHIDQLVAQSIDQLAAMRISAKSHKRAPTPKFPLRIAWDLIKEEPPAPKMKMRERSIKKETPQPSALKEDTPVRHSPAPRGVERSRGYIKLPKPVQKKPTNPSPSPQPEPKPTARKSKVKPVEPDDFEEMQTSLALGSTRPPGWIHPPPPAPCGCKRVCGENCLYRMIRIKCTQKCTAETCHNKAFPPQNPSLYVGKRGKGPEKEPREQRLGLYSHAKLEPKTFLCEFAGEVIDVHEMQKRTRERYGRRMVRAMALASRIFVDATEKGNIGRFVTHSCNPNAESQIWLVGGRLKAGIYTTRHIEPNEEITISMTRRHPDDFRCHCAECRSQKRSKVVAGARVACLAQLITMTEEEKRKARALKLLVPRNTNSYGDQHARDSAPVRLMAPEKIGGKGSLQSMRHVLRLIARRARHPDGSMARRYMANYMLCRRALRIRCSSAFAKETERFAQSIGCEQLFRTLSFRYLNRKRERDEEKADRKDEKRKREEEEEKPRRKSLAGVDLSYLDDEKPIGSYDPDEAWPTGKANESDEAVRCICGALEEDGEMLQCDGCHYWLHNDCVGLNSVEAPDEYLCDFCSGKIPSNRPSTDVLLKHRPDYSYKGCEYYKALVNSYGLQVRLNETIYVEKFSGEEHKKALKKAIEVSETAATEKRKLKKQKKTTDTLAPRLFSRKNVGIMRVERLFVTADGQRWVFGLYYARPHETFRDPNKSFHPNEVLCCVKMYDTLPLDSIAGRCAVLSAKTWCKGRPIIPKLYSKDLLFCEYGLHEKARMIKKLAENEHYFVNQQPYVFQTYGKKREIKRTLQPFLLSPNAKLCIGSPSPACSSQTPNKNVFERGESAIDKENLKKRGIDRLSLIVDRIKRKSAHATQRSKETDD